jgi:putative transposase
MEIIEDYAQFFTATIYEWKPLLKNNKYKEIIVDSLSFLTKEKRANIYAFVIMSNHIHLIWQMRSGHLLKNVQRDFLKYTAQQMRFDLAAHYPKLLNEFEVNLKDRKHQFWQRNPLNIPLSSKEVFEQKLDYIHQNPVKAGLCNLPEKYHYSSASYYYEGKSEFEFITDHRG